jgi:hypothetical protein
MGPLLTGEAALGETTELVEVVSVGAPDRA